ncbi:MAG: hypothetical protein V7752_07080 [Halopseudomonas sp.]
MNTQPFRRHTSDQAGRLTTFFMLPGLIVLAYWISFDLIGLSPSTPVSGFSNVMLEIFKIGILVAIPGWLDLLILFLVVCSFTAAWIIPDSEKRSIPALSWLWYQLGAGVPSACAFGGGYLVNYYCLGVAMPEIFRAVSPTFAILGVVFYLFSFVVGWFQKDIQQSISIGEFHPTATRAVTWCEGRCEGRYAT